MKMKTVLNTCFFALCFLIKLEAQSADGFIINGNIKNFNPSFIYLDYEKDGAPHTDSVKVMNGKFIFHGQLDNPMPAMLYFKEKSGDGWEANTPLEFYLEPGTLTIAINDSISKSVVTGGSTNSDYAELKKFIKPLIDDWDATLNGLTNNQTKTASQKIDSANADNKFDSLNKELIKAYQSFARSHPNSFVSLYALQRTNGELPDVNIIDPIFNAFSPAIKNSKSGLVYGKKVHVWNTVKIGVTAPQFSLPDSSGKQISLTKYKRKYVLVDFWASWCVPCREENPNVLKAYNTYKNKNFDILSISEDESKQSWMKAVQEDKLPWQQLCALTGWDNDVQKLYDIQFIPQNFLIDPNGIIIARNLRGDALQNKLQQIFNN